MSTWLSSLARPDPRFASTAPLTPRNRARAVPSVPAAPTASAASAAPTASPRRAIPLPSGRAASGRAQPASAPNTPRPATSPRAGAASTERPAATSRPSVVRSGGKVVAEGDAVPLMRHSSSARGRVDKEEEEAALREAMREAGQVRDNQLKPLLQRVADQTQAVRDDTWLREVLRRRVMRIVREKEAAHRFDFVAVNIARSTLDGCTAAEEQRKERFKLLSERSATARTLMVQRKEKLEKVHAIDNSETRNTRRAMRRLTDLRLGFNSLRSAAVAHRAQAWLRVLMCLRATRGLARYMKAARLARRARHSSRFSISARALQRAFRDQKQRELDKLRAQKALVIQRCARTFRFRKAILRKSMAASTLRSFLQSSLRLTPTELALKRYSRRVRHAQAVVRSYQSVTKARLLLLGMQWDRIEQEILRQMHRTAELAAAEAAERAAAATPGAAAAAAAVAGKWRKSAHVPAGLKMPHVPWAVRLPRLRRMLTAMRRRYIKELAVREQQVMERMMGSQQGRSNAWVREQFRLTAQQQQQALSQSLEQSRGQVGGSYSNVIALLDSLGADQDGGPPPKASPPSSPGTPGRAVTPIVSFQSGGGGGGCAAANAPVPGQRPSPLALPLGSSGASLPIHVMHATPASLLHAKPPPSPLRAACTHGAGLTQASALAAAPLSSRDSTQSSPLQRSIAAIGSMRTGARCGGAGSAIGSGRGGGGGGGGGGGRGGRGRELKRSRTTSASGMKASGSLSPGSHRCLTKLEEGRELVRETRRELPPPWMSVLAATAEMEAAVHEARDQCKRDDTWDMRVLGSAPTGMPEWSLSPKSGVELSVQIQN